MNRRLILIFFGFFIVLNAVLALKLYLDKKIPKDKISFVSELKDFELEYNNVELLKEYLDKIDFFNSEAITLREGSQEKVSVSHLVIHLSDQVYPFNRFTSKDKGTLRSTKELFSKGTLDLFIGLNKEVYLSQDLGKGEQALASQILNAGYELTHPEFFSNQKTLSRETLPSVLIETADKAKAEGYFASIIKKN